jgi:Flp pilus assembly protein TadD
VSQVARTAHRSKRTILRAYAQSRAVVDEDTRALTSPVNTPSARRDEAAYELELAKIHLDKSGDLKKARRHVRRALRLTPLSPRGLFNLALAFAPRPLRMWNARRRRQPILRRENESASRIAP